MEFKKATAVILCAAMTASVCACNNTKKATAEIEGLLDDYACSLRAGDFDDILDMTSWDEDDKAYKNAQEVFTYVNTGTVLYNHEAYILSTITIDYDSEDIEINGKEASLKFKYELVDWQAVYRDPSDSVDEVLEKLKSSKDTISVSGKLEFELVDGEWKISKIGSLDKLFEFSDGYPYIVVVDDPVYTDPAATDFDDYFSEAIQSYIYLLERDDIRSSIKNIEDNYSNMEACGLYDLDKDGVPELYFIAGDDTTTYTGSLYFYSYNEFAGEAVEFLGFPNVIYQAGDGGSFLVYTIKDGFVVQTANGGELDWNVNTYVYGLDCFEQQTFTYREELVFDGDDFDDCHMEYEYYCGNRSITEDEYSNSILTLISLANVVVINRYYISDDSTEAPLLALPSVGMQTYEDTLDTLYSML